MWRLKVVAAVVVLVGLSIGMAGKEFTLPKPENAKTYAARDEHASEHVTVAIDPYDTSAKAELFKTKWREYGYLPVFLIVSNDGDEPVALTGIKIQWITLNRSKLSPATEGDLARRLTSMRRGPNDARRNPLPVPLPPRNAEVGLPKEARQELDGGRFQALAVEAHATRAGFLFFDISGIREPMAGAHVFVDGIRDASGQELMYFEIPVDKYLDAPAAKR